MTDERTKTTPNQPSQPASQPTPPPPPTPPTEPSGTGFAAINLPRQQPPAGPPTYNSYNPPPPPPPAPTYQFDYSRQPSTGGNGPQILLVAALGFVLVLLVGVGGMLALGIGPFARATPVPTLVAQPSPTARPHTPAPTTTSGATQSTAAPSPSGSAGPTSTPTPIPSGDVADALLSHIPLAIEPTCTVTANGGPIVASARCSVDDGNIQVLYLQYADHDSMFAKYEGYRLESQIEPDSGDCNQHDSWPAEAAFSISGVAAGRWLCTEALGATSIYWTDDRLNILSEATQTVPDYARLIEFWVHESGPNLEPFSN